MKSALKVQSDMVSEGKSLALSDLRVICSVEPNAGGNPVFSDVSPRLMILMRIAFAVDRFLGLVFGR